MHLHPEHAEKHFTASANGTVRPSDMPTTTSRTASLAVKSFSECAVEARPVSQWRPGHNCRCDRDGIKIKAHHKSLPGRDFRPYCVFRGEFRIARQGPLKGEIERMDSPATYFHWGFILISV